MEDLKDDNVILIGIFGMAGVGSMPALVKQVAKIGIESKLFDQTDGSCSQSPGTLYIQEEIAEMLDLKIDMQSEALEHRDYGLNEG